MSDRRSDVDILDLSLDEYIRLYVRTDFKRKSRGRRNQNQHQRRYDQSQNDGPTYRQYQRGRLQEHLPLKQQQQQQREQQQQQREQQQQRRQPQQQKMKHSETLAVTSNTCISKLRMEQKRLQQKSLQEISVLQERLRVQQQKIVDEIRDVQMRHRQKHIAIQKLIDEERIKNVQYFIGQNVEQIQEMQELHDEWQWLLDNEDAAHQSQELQIQPLKMVASKSTSISPADIQMKDSGQ